MENMTRIFVPLPKDASDEELVALLQEARAKNIAQLEEDAGDVADPKPADVSQVDRSADDE